MFKAERIQKIKEIIFDRKQVDVLTLSSLLGVSDVTVRSDLEQLEQSGFITRMHGGAVLNESTTRQITVNDALSCKSIEYDKNKEEIGKIAASLINDREWIFIGPGATCYYIAKELVSRKSVNIVTNNFYVVNVLGANPGINLVFAGGRLSCDRYCAYGDIFARCLSDIFISKAYFTVGGADLQAGYTFPDSAEADIIKTVAARSRELIFAVDKSKFGNISFIRLGGLDFAKTVITNDKAPEQYKKYYFENGVKIFTSYDIKPLAL